MGTANQKSTIDTHTQKREESKHNNKDSPQTTREGTREEGNKKRSTKTNPNQLIRK